MLLFCLGFAFAIQCAIVLYFVLMIPSVRGKMSGGKFDLQGRSVVVTGAASGIGKELCLSIARKSNCHVHMVDTNEDMLGKAELELNTIKDHSTKVWTHVCDVTKLEDVRATGKRIRLLSLDCGEKHVSLLVNNAGKVKGEKLKDLDVEAFEYSMKLGAVSHFAMIKEFLPGMLTENDGTIVTMSSLMGLLPGCRLGDYCSAKSSVIGLNDSLSLELGTIPGNRVHCLLVCPYAVDTGMFNGAFRAPDLFLTRYLFPFLKTQDVVDRILVGIYEREYVVVLPWILTLVPYVARVLPVPLFQVVLKLFGGVTGMDTYKRKGD